MTTTDRGCFVKRIGIDVGGTNTDAALLDGAIVTATREDPDDPRM